MLFERQFIPDVIKITPKRHGDDRGFFSELFREDQFQAEVGPVRFVQDNQSLSATAGTLRGLHFQREPVGQGKLIRCLSGAILDVAVDIRSGSSTYGQHVAAELTPENGAWLWIPVGFAHGFVTLKPETTVLYKVTSYYSPEHDSGIRWNDPALSINWPMPEASLTLSAKDQTAPLLEQIEPPFQYAATGA
ncbi:dTDP-4-dehydrorhamnose 3,5-epimerase [Pannonibacter tanglangensis]|uniref:dTDP-4-dehydrorhamnose 3,5-epimerase n=1 Tax=Pannonibacter tanglangensis TaxID=2750084 RepID=A0ABW9ZCJ9_9HYPH|nr:dTDP-4-dehydrorhamnose 3,5-epimerase [Pannonibacter sp. XCT-34]NBN62388.1 dTDP-4-dehydrorhamnose 3,5-epimerase [Pannonibacter sp. XCT-34]